MANINFKLFGNPIILEDEKEIYLPPGKVSALLYYILLKKLYLEMKWQLFFGLCLMRPGPRSA